MLEAHPGWTAGDVLDLDLGQLDALARGGKPRRDWCDSAAEVMARVARVRDPDYRPWDEVL